MKSKILVFLILLNQQLQAQIIINGFCDFPNTTISLFEIEDCITKKEKKISETEVDDKGNFKLIFSSNQIKKIILRINSNFTWMYVQPNSSYFIDIPQDGQITQFKTNNEIEKYFQQKSQTGLNRINTIKKLKSDNLNIISERNKNQNRKNDILNNSLLLSC